MKALRAVLFLLFGLAGAAAASGGAAQAQQLENDGDSLAARAMLHRAAIKAPQDATAVLAYAEFLDRHHDPETRANYERAFALANGSQRTAIAERLALLAVIDGDRDAASKYIEVCRSSGRRNWKLGEPAPDPDTKHTVLIPGPLEAFSRMAALSPDTPPTDILAGLARNVTTNGYQASTTGEALEPTEYMKLIMRYLSQARELQKLAGDKGRIEIETCESPRTAELLRILGYRMRGACGSEVVLETVNATRAFLTIDSGFPIAALEQALRTNRPFFHPYGSTAIPILYGSEYWLSDKKQQTDFVEAFLGDPTLCRLYLGFAHLDPDTASALREAMPLERLKIFAHVLDFFGNMFEIRSGKAVVPGGAKAAAMWAELAGVPPDRGAAFLEKLLAKDDGWLAAYFDALARLNGPVKDYLIEPQRLKRFYMAVRGRITSPGPARPVFRSNTDLMLLTARLRVEPGGRPHIPGGVEVWKTVFATHPHTKLDSRTTRPPASWKEPDDVLEGLFALSRKTVDNEPVKVFMALSDLNRARTKPLEPATVERLAHEYQMFGAQYSIFSESPAVSDATILAYLEAAKAVNGTGDTLFRANAAGMMQSLTGLWQILCRQNVLPEAQADAALSAVLTPFQKMRNPRELFDAGRAGVRLLLKATGAPGNREPQERLMDLLAGAADSSAADVHALVVQEMIRHFEAQRLMSLDTLFDLADNLESVARGEKLNTALAGRLASRITEIQLPRTGLTGAEKNAFALGYWTERHLDFQRRLNLRGAIEKAANDPDKLADIRGLLAPILRDTLVGLNYVHYAPPSAQILLTNPIFVRTHDFIGLQGAHQTWKATEVLGLGWPTSAGGRLVGSLAGLPYALAEAEQNFMVPRREQALIWGDLAPQVIVSAKVPRWWNVTPAQMHWVGLHMRYGESLVAEAALDPARREAVLATLEQHAPPERMHRVGHLLEQGDVPGALNSITPLELFALAKRKLEAGGDDSGPLAEHIRTLRKEAPPDRISYAAISHAFGTPKPTLTTSLRPELLYVRLFPTLMGYSSRIMAETWESTILYWAALADEVHVAPAQLNLLIPEWTQKTVERIFATHLEDWPALLRSQRAVGEDVRLRLRMLIDTDQKASIQ